MTRLSRSLRIKRSIARYRVQISMATVLAVALTGAAAPAQGARNVAVIGSDYFTIPVNADVQSKLLATGQFDVVDTFDIETGAPTHAQMQQYCGVLVYPGDTFDSVAFGNDLADYVDSGGGVVAALFATGPVLIEGRFTTDNYWAMQPTPLSFLSGTMEGLGTIFEPDHPILAGVSSFTSAFAFRPGFDNLHPAATRVANWTGPGNIPLIATRVIDGKRRVDLGFYPPTNGSLPSWDPATDGALIMANAMTWVCAVCGNSVTESGEACDDGNLVDGDGCDSNCRITACGNGIVSAGEECDDGNLSDNDCCSSSCAAAPDGTVCSDGWFCNGADTCASGACATHAGDPCASGVECNNLCNEANDHCIAPSGTVCADDGNHCTTDYCNGLGICAHPSRNFEACDDGLFCNGPDYCLDDTCSLHLGDPCIGNTCNDRCDEVTVQCLASTSGTACFEDGLECTSDECDGTGTCVHLPIPDCATYTPTATRTPTPTRTHTRTATATITPISTSTPTSAPAPAALGVHRVRVRANTSTRDGVRNGTVTVRGFVNANAPFDNLEADVEAAGVALRIAGGGGIEMTHLWPASSCTLDQGKRGARIICDIRDESGRRKLQLRPMLAPNTYSLRFVGNQLAISSPRSDAPVRVVLITETSARQDDIYACTVSGAQSQVSLCDESGIVPTPTPAAPLGERLLSVARPGSAITTSALANFDVSTDPWSPSELRLWAGAPDVDGVAQLKLLDDVIIGAKIIDGSTFCIKIFGAGSHGTIDCDGGTPYDLVDTYDSNGAGPSGLYIRQTGLGSDAGPGAATLFAGWNAYLLGGGTTIADCQHVSYFNGDAYGFTTAMATATFANPVQGGVVSQSALGQNFDCATWTQENGPGKLLRPMLPTDTIAGDVANVLAIADAPSTEPPPAPTLTPTATP